MNEWISVEDRLPEKGDIVWCFCFEDYQQVAWYEQTARYSDAVSHLFKTPDHNYVSVTHWMPLPPPPES